LLLSFCETERNGEEQKESIVYQYSSITAGAIFCGTIPFEALPFVACIFTLEEAY